MIATVSGTSTTLVLVLAVFLAATVEMVEALTIVVAVGHTRGWRSALEGTGAALVALGLLVAIFGPTLVRVPLDPLRLVVGSVLLIFGLQWLRKAILRASGYLDLHDEDVIYEKTVASLRAQGVSVGRDRTSFVVAFKGVFLEGVEIVVAVLTLGTSAHRLGLAIGVAFAGVANGIVSTATFAQVHVPAPYKGALNWAYGTGSGFGVAGTIVGSGGLIGTSTSIGDAAYGSDMFGADSSLFGNSSLGSGNEAGLLNQGGSSWRIGWSVNNHPVFRIATPFFDHLDLLTTSGF